MIILKHSHIFLIQGLPQFKCLGEKQCIQGMHLTNGHCQSRCIRIMGLGPNKVQERKGQLEIQSLNKRASMGKWSRNNFPFEEGLQSDKMKAKQRGMKLPNWISEGILWKFVSICDFYSSWSYRSNANKRIQHQKVLV